MATFVRRAARGWLLAVATLGIVGVASALPPGPPPEPDWAFEVNMYGWLSSVSADVTTDHIRVSKDISFKDLLSDLGWAFEGGTQLRYKRALLMVDAMGFQVADNVNENAVTRPFNLGGPLGPGGSLTLGPAKVSTRLTVWIVDPRLGFRPLSLPLSKLFTSMPSDDPRRLDVDLLAGVRYWNVRNKAGVDVDPATLTVGGTNVDISGITLPDFRGRKTRLPGYLVRGTNGAKHFNGDDDWADPMIGLRIRADVTEHISLVALGDIGGFSAWSSASDLTWQGMLGARWQFAKHFSAFAGYRALGLQRSGPLDNAILYGPLIGAIFNL